MFCVHKTWSKQIESDKVYRSRVNQGSKPDSLLFNGLRRLIQWNTLKTNAAFFTKKQANVMSRDRDPPANVNFDFKSNQKYEWVDNVQESLKSEDAVAVQKSQFIFDTTNANGEGYSICQRQARG